jgi:hypothetical protein
MHAIDFVAIIWHFYQQYAHSSNEWPSLNMRGVLDELVM